MKKQRSTSQATTSTYNTLKKIRNNWGDVKPITKIIPNHKHDYEYPDSYYDYYEEEEYDYK